MPKAPNISVKVTFTTGDTNSAMFGRIIFNAAKNDIGPESGERMLLIHRDSEADDVTTRAQVEKDSRKLVKLLNKYKVVRHGAQVLFTDTTSDPYLKNLIRGLSISHGS